MPSPESEQSASPAHGRASDRGALQDAWLASVLGLVATLVALAARQTSFFGDGRDIATLVEHGALGYHHLLYFPVARAFAWIVSPFASAPHETGPLLLAALAYGGAVAVTFGAARRLGLPRPFASATAALMAAAPVCVFHATCIEVHGVQLFVAALVARWLVECEQHDRATTPLATIPALLWIGLTGTHLSGGLWAPALLVGYAVAVRGRARAAGTRALGFRPLDSIAACAALALAVIAWLRVNSADPQDKGRGFIRAASESVLVVPDDLGYLWSQFVTPFGGLTVLASAVVLSALVRTRGRLAALDLTTGLALLLFAPFAAALRLDEQGGYFIALAPACALVVGRFAFTVSDSIDLGSDPKAARAPLAALWFVAAAHGIGANARWLDFNVRYAGSAWLEPLAGELEPGALVLTATYDEFRTVLHHSRLDALPFPPRELAVAPPEFVDGVIDQACGPEGPSAILDSLFASENRAHRALVERLVERFGEPFDGAGTGYLLFPGSASALGR